VADPYSFADHTYSKLALPQSRDYGGTVETIAVVLSVNVARQITWPAALKLRVAPRLPGTALSRVKLLSVWPPTGCRHGRAG